MTDYSISVNGTGMTGFLRVTETTNSAANTSTVLAIAYVSKSSGATLYGTLDSGTITINGNTNNFSGQTVSVAAGAVNQEINRHSVVVTHNADGTKSINVASSIYLGTGGSSWTAGSSSNTFTLTNYSRVPTTPTLTVTRPKSGTADTGETVNLSWTTATAPTGSPTSAIDWYEYRYSTDNSTWTTYNASNANGLGTATTASFGPTSPITVAPGTVYYFGVRAHASNSDGYGSWSTASTATGSGIAYAAPTITSVTSVGTTASVVVAAPSSNGGSTISLYTVQYSTDSGFGGTPGTTTLASPGTATITGLTPGRTYYFRVRYKNALNFNSPYSATSSAFISAYGRRYQTVSISGVSAIGATTTYTTSAAHGFSVGDTVAVTGIVGGDLNRSGTITAVSTSGTFSFTIPTSTATTGARTGGGTAAGWALMLTGKRYSATYDSTGTITAILMDSESSWTYYYSDSAYALLSNFDIVTVRGFSSTFVGNDGFPHTIDLNLDSQSVEIGNNFYGNYFRINSSSADIPFSLASGTWYKNFNGTWNTITTAQKYTAGAWTPFS